MAGHGRWGYPDVAVPFIRTPFFARTTGPVPLPAVRWITALPHRVRPCFSMPVLIDGPELCALQAGTYTLGGIGVDAVPLARLETCPPVATIVVPPDGPATIQRLTAAVVVRLDRTPLGIAAKPLADGAQIEFGDCCLTFNSDADGNAAVTSEWIAPASAFAHDSAATLAARPASPASAGSARIVNARTGERIQLGEQRVVVGRDQSCDFVVSDMHVSRRHFSVAPVQGGYMLRDESANGTLVNGTRVFGTFLLGPGDELRVGDELLRFEIEGVNVSRPSIDSAPTTLLDLSCVRDACADDAGQELPSAHTATLEIVRGQFAGASFVLDRSVCVIGRGPQSDVRIRDESVSSDHATLLRKGANWFVVDLRSANGTFVDGSRVAGERELANGSRLKLGRVELAFRAHDAAGDVPLEKKRSTSWVNRVLAFFRR